MPDASGFRLVSRFDQFKIMHWNNNVLFRHHLNDREGTSLGARIREGDYPALDFRVARKHIK
ncbi:MAG: hypothetical protein ACRD2B_05905 [Terriglobia bacterium]